MADSVTREETIRDSGLDERVPRMVHCRRWSSAPWTAWSAPICGTSCRPMIGIGSLVVGVGVSDMSPSEAIRWLSAGAARACDAIGNRAPRRAWNTRDVEAVHVLERTMRAIEVPDFRVTGDDFGD